MISLRQDTSIETSHTSSQDKTICALPKELTPGAVYATVELAAGS